MWPVAIPDAFAVVKVGNNAWLLRRLTPSRAIFAMVGAVLSSTIRKRKPSATNRTTLLGRGIGAVVTAADASVVDKIAVPKSNSGRMNSLRAKKLNRVNMAHEAGMTVARLQF